MAEAAELGVRQSPWRLMGSWSSEEADAEAGPPPRMPSMRRMPASAGRGVGADGVGLEAEAPLVGLGSQRAKSASVREKGSCGCRWA